jgi:hypothetical protein
VIRPEIVPATLVALALRVVDVHRFSGSEVSFVRIRRVGGVHEKEMVKSSVVGVSRSATDERVRRRAWTDVSGE